MHTLAESEQGLCISSTMQPLPVATHKTMEPACHAIVLLLYPVRWYPQIVLVPAAGGPGEEDLDCECVNIRIQQESLK